MFDVDGAILGYGSLAPEPLVELIAAGKTKGCSAARAIHDRVRRRFSAMTANATAMLYDGLGKGPCVRACVERAVPIGTQRCAEPQRLMGQGFLPRSGG
jgi:dihydrodipicolinate synthase/N-acetylneuraminate lyase